MIFTEVVNAVVDNVKRPDKLTMIRREVNAAILGYSSAIDHPRDLTEVQLPLPSDSSHTISLASLPRFRKVDWMRYPASRKYVDELALRRLDCDTDIRDKYYVAGDSLKVSLSGLVSSLDISYYTYPPYLTDSSPHYWQLDANWAAIIAKASSKVFSDIGDDNSARSAAAEAAVHFIVFAGEANRGH